MPLQLADVGNLALGEGLDPEGAMAVMAIAQTEGGLGGAVGDNGQSHGPLQFYSGGQLQNFAADLGVSPVQAAQIATAQPDLAVRWALSPKGAYGWSRNGYLGDTVRAAQRQGLRGADLASYAQRFGQVSVSPERAGQNYAALWGDYVPGSADQLPTGADQAAASWGGPSRVDVPNQFTMDPQLTPQEAAAWCGPNAAMAFAAAYGRYPTLGEAKQIATSKNLWDTSSGMHGPQSELSLINDFGVPGAHFDQTVDWNGVQSRAVSGAPTILSTPGHYFYVDDFNPQAGTYHVGGTGLALKSGSDWMSPDQMTALEGPFSGAIWADPNSSPGGAPS